MFLKPGTLENPFLSRKLHNLWISEICQYLKPQVKGKLTLSIGEEITLVDLSGERSRLYPDLHLTGGADRKVSGNLPGEAINAVAHAVGTEEWSRETRHYLVLHDLSGEQVVAILEVLSPTNKGYYSQTDLDAFRDRRQRLLSGGISYMEIDAIPVGTRWLPRSLVELHKHAGVVWESVPSAGCERRFEGWAWAAQGPLPTVPWDLGPHGSVKVDLEYTGSEAAGTAGLEVPVSP